jgi:hypothetical protein
MSDETSDDGIPKEKPPREPVPESVVQGGFGFLRDVFDKDVPFKSKILGLAFIAGSGLLTLAGYNFIVSDKSLLAYIREGQATFSTTDAPILDPSKFESIAQSLTKAGAKSVAIYDVDLGGVQRTLVYAAMDGDPEKNFIGDKDSLYARLGVRDNDDDRLRKGRYNEMVFKLQNGDFVCENLEPTTRYGAYLFKNEIKYTCAIGLPTGLTKFFMGSIVVGFDGEFDSSQEDFMRSSLYQAGQDILIK